METQSIAPATRVVAVPELMGRVVIPQQNKGNIPPTPHLVVNANAIGSNPHSFYLLGDDGKTVHFDPTATLVEDITAPDLDAWRRVVNGGHSLTFATPIFNNGMYSTTAGSDPEVFVRHGDGTIFPAFEFLPSKDQAMKEKAYTEQLHRDANHDPHWQFRPSGVFSNEGSLNCPAFWDGFQAEFTTTPSTCLEMQCDRVRNGMRRVLSYARVLDPSATLTLDSIIELPYETLMTTPKQYLQFGCAPSKNVYGDRPPAFDAPQLVPFRSAGWHMHFAANFSSAYSDAQNPLPLRDEDCQHAIRALDRILGVAMVSLGDGFHDKRRRELYGRAGEYRVGRTLEYRVPEPIMGCHPAIWNLCWDLGRSAYWFGIKRLEFLWDSTDDETRHVINSYDVPLAREILARNRRLLCQMLLAAYGNADIADLGYDVLCEGLTSVVPYPTDIEGNWRLRMGRDDSDDWPFTATTGRDNTKFISWVGFATAILQSRRGEGVAA